MNAEESKSNNGLLQSEEFKDEKDGGLSLT